MSGTTVICQTLNEWPANYFNFFTEIEEHFQRARGTGLFLMSPLDWALVESWSWDVLHRREGSSTESGHHPATAEIVARRPDHSPEGGAA